MLSRSRRWDPSLWSSINASISSSFKGASSSLPNLSRRFDTCRSISLLKRPLLICLLISLRVDGFSFGRTNLIQGTYQFSSALTKLYKTLCPFLSFETNLSCTRNFRAALIVLLWRPVFLWMSAGYEGAQISKSKIRFIVSVTGCLSSCMLLNYETLFFFKDIDYY